MPTCVLSLTVYVHVQIIASKLLANSARKTFSAIACLVEVSTLLQLLGHGFPVLLNVPRIANASDRSYLSVFLTTIHAISYS